MKFEGIESKRRRLVLGVFPWLFYSLIIMALVLALMLDELFLPFCVFFPVGYFLALQYTIYYLRRLPPAERRLYIDPSREGRGNTKNKKTQGRRV